MKNLYENLLGDVNKIARELNKIFGLRYPQGHLDDTLPLRRWFDYTHRYIKPKKRSIKYSNRFPRNDLSDDDAAALKKIEMGILNGEDINAYQTKGLINNNPVKNNHYYRTDLLWADHGIWHLHLGHGGNLLFCLVNDDYIAFIDILEHAVATKLHFAINDLTEYAILQWPENFLELKGVHGINNRSDNETYELRVAGISSNICVNGKVYISQSLGLNTSSTSTKVSLAIQQCYRYVKKLSNLILDPTSDFQNIKSGLHNQEKSYSLRITPLGIAVIESISSTAFLLKTHASANSWLTHFYDFLLPSCLEDKVIDSLFPPCMRQKIEKKFNENIQL